MSNKSDDKNASLYYQSNETFEILNFAKRNSNIKFTSEYIIDSYIFKFYKNPDEFVNFLTFLKEQDIKKYIKFSIILLSHPFIIHNLESKKSIIESNLDEVVPENGYAYEKIKRFKLIFSTAD